MRFASPLLCIFLVASLGTAQTQRDWPCWMGKKLDGVSTESGWSAQWPEEGLVERWSREIGIGFSSVAIAGKRLLTMGHVDGDEIVYCLDCDSGEVLWTHEYPCELIDNLYEGGPGATPTIDGDKVYTLGKEGQLCCLELDDGEVVWRKDLQEDLGVPLPEWGFNSSPLIHAGAVIVEAGRVVSYDKASGKKRWQSEKHVAGYGCVRSLVAEGKNYLVVLDCDSVRVLREANGEEVDSYPWQSPFETNSTTPIIMDDTIFISTGYQVGCGLFQLRDEELVLLYDHRKMRNHFNNSIFFDGHLYGFDGNSNLGRVVHLKCMDVDSGNVVWSHRGLGCGSLMIADGKIVALSDDGRLVVAEATPEGFEPLGEAQILEGRCWTVPVLLRGRVYARSARGKLVCVELPAADKE